MSEQYPGGFISKTEPTVNGSVARGMWTLSQAAGYAKQGLWPTVPAAPTIGTATAGDASASVTFTAPSNIGSAAITSYTVTSSPGGLTGTGASSPVTVSGLTNGTAYTFTVTATNGAGTGPASSPSGSVTPVKPPPALISSSTFDTASLVNTFTINAPATITSGNLLVCFITKVDNTGNPSSVPSGWTRAVTTAQNSFSYIYYKTATGSEPANYTWSGFGNSNQISATIQNWRYAAYYSTTVQQDFKNSPTYANPTPTLGPLTSPAANSVIIFMIGNEDAGQAFNTPSGFTAVTPLGTSHKSSIFLFYKTGVASGSTGTITVTPNSANSGQVPAQMILLNAV